MESSTQHVGPDPAEKLVRLAAKPADNEPTERSEDPYAKAELERRHERIELMIRKAQRLS